MQPQCPDCRALLRGRELTEPFDCSHELGEDGLMYHCVIWRTRQSSVILQTNGERSKVILSLGDVQISKESFLCFETALDALTLAVAERFGLE